MSVKIFLVFISALTLDGLLLPALFDFKKSILSLLVPIVLILYMGCEKRYVVYGLFFSIISELFRGLDFGALALPFLLAVSLIYLVQTFLDIKHVSNVEIGMGRLILFVLASILFIFLFSTVYELNEMIVSGKEPPSFLNGYPLNLAVNLETVLEILLVIFVFDRIFSNKTHVHTK